MKKIILTLVASLALVSAAQAEPTASIIYGSQKDNTTHALSDVIIYDLKTNVYKYTDVDLQINNRTAVGTNLVTNRVEPGITVTYPILDMISVYIRPSVGIRQKSGTESFYYYTSEQGIKMYLPYNVSATVGYYYRDSFDPVNHDQLGTMRYYLGYNVTETTKISVGIFRDTSGYNQATTNWIGLSHNF